MRNKAKFIEDAYAAMKDEYKEEINVVEDAAHVMKHTGDCCYKLPGQFTLSGKDEIFEFEKRPRPLTDDPTQSIDDYFYLGKENA